MQCGTCKEASSTQLPVSEVCRQCHEFSKWCQAVPNYRMYELDVTLFLCEYNGYWYASTIPSEKVLDEKKMQACFKVQE